MQKYKMLILIFFFLSCENNTETTPVDPDQTKNVIQPLKVGNIWNYVQTDSNSDITSETRQIISKSNSWYEIDVTGTGTFFLSNLSDGLHFLVSSTESLLLIKYPASLNEEFLSANALYKVESVDTMIVTSAGTFSCYQYSRYTKTNKLQTQNFYSVDIGYIKRIDYDTLTSTIDKTLELTSYLLK